MFFRLLPYIFIIATLGGAYLYYKDTQQRLELAAANLAKAETAAVANKQAFDQLQLDMVSTQAKVETLNVNLREAEVYQDELIAKLRRHDLTRLSEQRPGMIEKRINDATQAIFNDLEQQTAIPTPSE